MNKKNFIENQTTIVKNLSLEACEFYMNNVKDEEMKMVDEYIYDGNYPPYYKYNLENVEDWLRHESNINTKFIIKFQDNLSVMAFLHMNNLCKAVLGLVY